MEKISSTPLSHNNSGQLTEISATNTTMGTVLNCGFDGMPKLAESSVRAAVPLRANFKKSNTCGSLFANCKCSHHSQTIIPLITETDCDKVRPKLDRHSGKNQSFSHPDTPVIFTEENRYPLPAQIDSPGRLRASQEIIFKNGNHKVEVQHSKRSSSPNIGEFTISNVEIHPEFKVQVIPKSPPIAETPRRRAVLKKGSKSFPSASRSPFRSFDSVGERTFSSSYSVDEEGEEAEFNDDVIVTDLDASSTSLSSPSPTVVEAHVLPPQSAADEKPSQSSSVKKPETDTAAKFFQV